MDIFKVNIKIVLGNRFFSLAPWREKISPREKNVSRRDAPIPSAGATGQAKTQRVIEKYSRLSPRSYPIPF